MNRFLTRLFFLFYLFSLQSLSGQNATGNRHIDSLLSKLAATTDTRTKIDLLDKISFSFSRLDPEQGVKYALEGLKLSEKLNWKKGMASAHAELGINYAALAKYDKAYHHDSIALVMYETMDHKSSVAGVLANLSTLYLAQSDYTRALEYGFKALRVNEE